MSVCIATTSSGEHDGGSSIHTHICTHSIQRTVEVLAQVFPERRTSAQPPLVGLSPSKGVGASIYAFSVWNYLPCVHFRVHRSRRTIFGAITIFTKKLASNMVPETLKRRFALACSLAPIMLPFSSPLLSARRSSPAQSRGSGTFLLALLRLFLLRLPLACGRRSWLSEQDSPSSCRRGGIREAHRILRPFSLAVLVVMVVLGRRIRRSHGTTTNTTPLFIFYFLSLCQPRFIWV